MPYIATSYDGMDQTGNFKDKTQLSVPATIGYKKSSPWILDAQELRDQLQENRLGDAAKQKLASDINLAVSKVASLQGTLVVKRTGAATGFDDVALADAIMNEQGIPMNDRRIALATRDYNSMAGDLAKRLAGDLAKVLKTVPENTGVNWSNTINAGLAGLFDFVFVQGTTGLPLPIATLLRQFVKRVGDKKQVARANMIINSLEKSRRQASNSF